LVRASNTDEQHIHKTPITTTFAHRHAERDTNEDLQKTSDP